MKFSLILAGYKRFRIVIISFDLFVPATENKYNIVSSVLCKDTFRLY